MPSLPGPADNSTWQPATSGNRLAREGEVVVKRYGARLGAFARESTLLARFDALANSLPVPRLLPARQFGEVRYAYVAGVSGVDAIAGGLAAQVLGAMGAFLRHLHALPIEPYVDVLSGRGPVVAHGDYAPYNVLVDGGTGSLLAVLDWEEARQDTPALDLAWCEAQVLGRFPHLQWALRHLYEGYGVMPERSQLEFALARRMAELSARAQTETSRSPADEGAILYRRAFSDRDEAAAFVAALSRALASPAGVPYQHGGAEALVWAADEDRAVYLTSTALRAVTERFGAPSVTAVALADVPASTRLLFGAGAVAGWGADTARARMTMP